jgi:DNA-binding transcriptional LysR family regulator
MNLELLRTFVDLARSPGLASVAARRHVTKSAVSQQMKALEAQLGVRLFERVGRTIRPTESAQALAAPLAAAFAAVDDALDALRDAEGTVRGQVRIGAPRPFTRAWLRPRLARLLASHPELVVDVSFGVPTELERALLAGDLDLAVLARAPESDAVATAPLFVETFEAVASRAYVRAHGSPETAADFERHRLVVFDRDLPMHGPWWRATFGGRAPLRGRVVCRVASLDEMLALATEGLGIAVLPDYFVAPALAARQLVIIRPSAHGRRATAAKNTIFLAERRGAVVPARVRTMREALLGGASRQLAAPP